MDKTQNNLTFLWPSNWWINKLWCLIVLLYCHNPIRRFWLLRIFFYVYYSNIVLAVEGRICFVMDRQTVEQSGGKLWDLFVMGFLFVFVLLMIIISHLIQPFGKKKKNDRLFGSILNWIDSLFDNQLINCKLYISDEYLPLKHSPNIAFWQITALFVEFIQCGSV